MTADKPNVQTRAGQAQLHQMGVKPIPCPDDLTRPYWEATRRHELRIQRCTPCGAYQHPPQPLCAACGSDDYVWAKLSGRGTVYTFVIDHRLMVPGFAEPYVVAQINPVEAQSDVVRLTTNIRDCDPDEVYIGMPVEVLFEVVSTEITLPQFRPALNGPTGVQ
jgi:uncharacterized OB-fold protein